MPDLTLVEYAKGLAHGAERAMVEGFAASSDIFEAMPFEGLAEGAPTYEGLREAELPSGLAFRGINEGSTKGVGKFAPFNEASYIFDHDIDVDDAIVRRYGERRLAQHNQLGAKAAGKLWTDTFFSGNNAANPKEFEGIQRRASRFSNRIIHNSAASGGAPLSLYNLDRSIANTWEPSHILASWNLMPRFIQAARSKDIAGFVIQSWDDVGTPKMTYNSIPILWGYRKDKHGVILPFAEVAQGGGSAVTTSMYVVSFREGGLRGIQLKALAVTGPKLLDDQITHRTHLSWDVGLVDEHEYCMTRLTSITDAAFVT
jgi:hypothetical protein